MGTSVGTRSRLLAFVIVAATFTGSAEAHAMGAIVTSPPGMSSATSLRIAVSSTGTRTSRWASIHVHGQATTFAWVVPVQPNAFVDLASDAWMEALEDATAPRVVPPDVVPPCGASGVEVEGDLSHLVTTPPDAVTLVPDATSLASVLLSWGLALPDDLAPLADAAGASGDAFLALRYTNVAADVTTRAVRIVDGSSGVLPLAWTRGTSSVDVTAYAFTGGGALVGSEPAWIDPAEVLWNLDGTSTYAEARATALTSMPGAWLLETAGATPIFAGESTRAPVPSIATAYFDLASTYGATTEDATTCTDAAVAISASASPVALACPAGSLAQGAEASCQEIVETTSLSPDALRCGARADDLALALSGLSPDGAWVTRARTTIPAATFGQDAAVTASASVEAGGPLVVCSGYAASCGSGSSSGAGPTGSGGGGSSAAGTSSGGGSDTGGGGGDQGGSDVGSTVSTVAGAAIESSDGCGGDSSDDSGDSCSGDSSSSDGDASSAGDCSGDSSTGSSGDCTTSRGRGHTHSPASRALLTLVAIVAFARRSRRGGRTT